MNFKIGDRVKHKNYDYGVGTIIYNITGTILVEFDKGNILFHDGLDHRIKGKNNHCWWISKEYLEKIEKIENILLIGQKVEHEVYGKGTILGWTDPINSIFVEFDKSNARFHGGGSFKHLDTNKTLKGKYPFCFYLSKNELTFITEQKSKTINLRR